LTGGEPLCHPDWFRLLRCARDLDFPQLALQTNADLIRDDTAEALASLDFPGLSIQVSLDGATAASHDLVRGTGAFAGALAGLKRLVAVGLAPRLSLFLSEMRHCWSWRKNSAFRS
jgi:MoaA/NifB/PqqE/SkfB family radical SAM enzyme